MLVMAVMNDKNDVEGDSFSRRLTRECVLLINGELFFQKRSRRLTKVGQPPNNCWCGGARNSRGYTCPCFDVMEDNVGDGRVSGEYNNWPYRAEYNLDEENDVEGFGRGW